MMLYRKLETPDGEYIDREGKCYTLQIVHATNIPRPFHPFESLEDCLAAWGLEPL